MGFKGYFVGDKQRSLPLKISVPFILMFLSVWLVGTELMGQYFSRKLDHNQQAQASELRALVEREIHYRMAQLDEEAQLIAVQDAIVQAAIDRDVAVLQREVLPMQSILKVDSIFVVDDNNQVLWDTHQDASQIEQDDDSSLIKRVIEKSDGTILVSLRHSFPPLLMGIAPISQGQDKVGHILLGTDLSDDFLSQISDLIDEPIVVVCDGEIVASTFPLNADVHTQEELRSTAQLTNADDPHPAFLTQVIQLEGVKEDAFEFRLLISKQPLLQAQRELRLFTISMAFVGAILITITGYWLARKLAQPIQSITKVAHQVVQENNFNLQISTDYHDELGDLASALNQLIQWTSQYTHKLEAMTQTLLESESRFSALAQFSPVGIFRTDTYGNCIYVNPRWCELTGLSPASVVGLGWAHVLHPQDRDRIFAQWYEVAQIKKPVSEEYRLKHRDGHEVWVYGQILIETDLQGQVVGYLGTFTDLTERRKIDQMRLALQKEKEMSDLKLRFFSMASHEFRTPLGVITMAAQILENTDPQWLDAKKIRNIHRIQNSAQGMQRMLTDVLQLARMDTDKTELWLKPLNLMGFCDRIVDDIQLGDSHLISLQFNSIENDTEVLLDENLLESMISNLLSNAVKYSPEGGQITFGVSLTTDEIIWSIKDTGIGIPVAEQAQIFDAFYRSSNVDKLEGTGLGLAIVKRGVDLHGGSLKLESQPGEGSHFMIYLPRHPLYAAE